MRAPSRESETYTAIVEALPANVAVEIDRDAGVVNFRVVGNRVAVQAEVDRIRRICADRAWLRLMGPIRWGDDYIVHGVLQQLPRCEATAGDGPDPNDEPASVLLERIRAVRDPAPVRTKAAKETPAARRQGKPRR
jgi:hypothetical protein